MSRMGPVSLILYLLSRDADSTCPCSIVEVASISLSFSCAASPFSVSYMFLSLFFNGKPSLTRFFKLSNVFLSKFVIGLIVFIVVKTHKIYQLNHF